MRGPTHIGLPCKAREPVFQGSNPRRMCCASVAGQLCKAGERRGPALQGRIRVARVAEVLRGSLARLERVAAPHSRSESSRLLNEPDTSDSMEGCLHCFPVRGAAGHASN